MVISKEQFEATVAEALDSLPEKFRDKLNNVAVIIEDFPSPEQLRQFKIKDKYDLFGVYEGYHQFSRLDFGPVLPDRIYIFRRPICRYCNTPEACQKQIRQTVKHEIAHYFGLDEKGARRAEKHA